MATGARSDPSASLVEVARTLFWDTEPSTLNVSAHWEYILGRILEYGTTDAVRWAMETYGEGKIREFILGRGLRVLSRKTVNYWAMRLGLQDEECIQRFLTGPRNPLWPS
ncbi:MAG TPA: hypothetical protein VLT62_00515 [Candidatus Methylomirabilis sp.]|nr:hypothetical protein [Candidatus Methylomirabilis sp.]